MSKIKTKGKNKWMIAEVDNSEQKREVMEKNRNLEKGVRTEDDLTKREKFRINHGIWRERRGRRVTMG